MEAVLQSESSECGLASLAMVASYHGQKLALRQLRQRFPLSLKGANLSRLIAVAGQLGFQCRPLRLDMEHLGQLKLPCVLHWDLSHFVVLAKVSKRKSSFSIRPSASASLAMPKFPITSLAWRWS